MNIKDTNFFNKESLIYSEKRYPAIAKSYTQFFFKERLRLTLSILKRITIEKKDLSLLEIGCADGVVLKEIQATLPGTFSSSIGIDISPEMIRTAEEKYGSTGIVFKDRAIYSDTTRKDCIIEIGVINYASLNEELDYIFSHLDNNGIAIISLAGTGSLWDRRRKTAAGFKTFLSYQEYEKAITQKFTIVQSLPVGLPIPLIWKAPFVGRIIESSVEKIARPLVPSLFHEKIYILKLAPKNQE
ncbi:class I SAM-dependent methyltransferase [Candidatus Parcubacteria bacterium]|nr:class I SAM-dependent methyltransferase [Candidatus Parcubacteria bacterium]